MNMIVENFQPNVPLSEEEFSIGALGLPEGIIVQRKLKDGRIETSQFVLNQVLPYDVARMLRSEKNRLEKLQNDYVAHPDEKTVVKKYHNSSAPPKIPTSMPLVQELRNNSFKSNRTWVWCLIIVIAIIIVTLLLLKTIRNRGGKGGGATNEVV